MTALTVDVAYLCCCDGLGFPVKWEAHPSVRRRQSVFKLTICEVKNQNALNLIACEPAI